jgi:uncharacterized phage protein (TIGR02218 family)
MTSGQYQRADLYTLTLVNGEVLRWTSWQVAIVSNGQIFAPVVRIGGDRKWKVTRGLEASTFSVTVGIDPENEMTINGVPFRQAARAGFLSGAQLQMDWAYLSDGALVGVLPRFFGTVGQVMPDRLGAQLTVNSPLKILDMQVPTKIYGPRCRWTLGDADCGVNLPSFAITAAIGGAATQSTLPTTLSNPDGYFNLGTITLTSGLNSGLKRQVRSYQAGQIVLATPLPFAPAVADTFSVTPGCDHTVPSFSTVVTIPNAGAAVKVATGASGYVGQGVVFATGPHTGQALLLVAPPNKPTEGQYANAGNVYTFSVADRTQKVTITFVTNAANGNGTCLKVFNNLARIGATPFIPAPEVQF